MGTALDSGSGVADRPGVGPLDAGWRASVRGVGAREALQAAGGPLRAAVRWQRRGLPLIVSLAALAWIITVIVLITVHPVAGTGNPMD